MLILTIAMEQFYLFIYDTPLTAAIKTKDEELIEMILNQNPNLKATDKFGRDPIYLAIESSNIDLYLKLIDSPNVDIFRKYGEYEQNLLHIACERACYPIFKSLLEHFEKVEDCPIQPDTPDNNGNTPLHFVVAYNPEKTGEEEEEEEDIDDEEEEEEEVNEYRKRIKDKNKIIRYLISFGCDPSQANKNGRCPFTLANPKTMEVMGKAMENPEYLVALQNRKDYWENLQMRETMKRFEAKKKSAKSQNDYSNIKSIRTSKTGKKERTKRDDFTTMISNGGTLRDKLPNLSVKFEVPKQSEIRPWGGSNETYKFQKDTKTKLRNMKKILYQDLDEMLLKANELKDMISNAKQIKRKNGDNDITNDNNEFVDSSKGNDAVEVDDNGVIEKENTNDSNNANKNEEANGINQNEDINEDEEVKDANINEEANNANEDEEAKDINENEDVNNPIESDEIKDDNENEEINNENEFNEKEKSEC